MPTALPMNSNESVMNQSSSWGIVAKVSVSRSTPRFRWRRRQASSLSSRAPDAVVALKDPNSLFEGSSAQNPYQMANDGVKVGFDIMNGKAPKDKVKLLPVPLVTKANLKDYPGWVKE